MERISKLFRLGLGRRCLHTLGALGVLLASAGAFRISKNSNSVGKVHIYAYSRFNARGGVKQLITMMPKSYLEGFEPFAKYNVAAAYLLNKDKSKRVTNFIDRPSYQSTIEAVFKDMKYFNNLKRSWKAKENLYIYDDQVQNFIHMINMANKPLHVREDGIFLKNKDINMILGLYEIFSLQEDEKIPEQEKGRTYMDITKRECFKENLRELIQNSKGAAAEYTVLIRDILHNKRASLMTEAPRSRIESSTWTEWLLARPNNKDVFWYLYTALCNERKDRVVHKGVIIYVEEDYMFGERGIRATLTKGKSPSATALNLTEYLQYRNPYFVNTLEIDITEGTEVPEMQFSSLLNMFSFAKLIVLRSLGNKCKIDRNLSLVNIVLDLEKKRQEQQRPAVLRGFMIEDYRSLNSFAKAQLTNMHLNALGYFAEMDRKKCCVEMNHPCLFPVERRSPNFFGKFSIPLAQREQIFQLMAPHTLFFNSNTVEGLTKLQEIDVAVSVPELEAEHHDSSLNTHMRKNMKVRTARLIGMSAGPESSYVDMVKKLLEIETLEELDISKAKMSTSDMLSVIKQAITEGVMKAKLKIFTFNYDEPKSRAAFSSNLSGGVQSLFEVVMKFFPELTTMNVHVDQGSPAIYNVMRDLKYMIGCSNYTPTQIKGLINIITPIPLIISSRFPCKQILQATLKEMYRVNRSIFKRINSCPGGQSVENIKKMTLEEFMVDLQPIFRRSVCTIPEDNI